MPKVCGSVNLERAKQVLAVFMILLLLLMVFLGCAAPQVEPSHLKVVALPYLSFATFYIPQEEGYFAEQGLEVEFVKFPTVTQAIPLLAQGSLDVAAGPLSASLINAIAQNINLPIVAGRERIPVDCEDGAMLVRRDLYESGELDTLAEIKGRTVVITSTGSISDFSLAKTLEIAGLTLDDVKMVQMRPADVIAAFENKAIDAARVGTPQLEQIQALGYAVILVPTNSVIPGFQRGFVMFGPSLVDDNPELGEKFMVAYLQGARQYAQGKTKRNLEILEKYIGMDEETLLQTCWSTIDPDGQVIVEDVLSFQDWLYDNGFVDEKVTREQLIDTRFIEYANKVLGTTP